MRGIAAKIRRMGASLMFYFLRSAFVAAILFLSLQLTLSGRDTQAPELDSGLASANHLYRAGNFAEAEYSYEVLLKTDPKLVPAQIGLVRSLLGQQNLDEALETVNAALAVQPNSAALLAAKGDVQLRGGEMAQAEMSYLAAQKLDPKEVRAQLGLAMLYGSYSLYRRAYDHLQIAHKIAPDDVEVELAWLSMLPRKQRLAAMQSYLDSPHPDQEEEAKWMTAYLESLKTTANQPAHACRLVSKVEQTDTKLEGVYTNRHRMRGIALSTKINNESVLLQVDTGASGIVVNRNFAEKAGLSRISAAYFRGIGDHGPQSGYRALANRIQIGDLEFEDCVIRVTENSELSGLIGTDVFGSYLIDLDLPEMQLKLSPLPKRPEDSVAPTSLSSELEESNVGQEDSEFEQTLTEQKSSIAKSAQHLPRDRYVAPEMANWTQVFRLGHNFLVQTSVNDSEPMLFLLDTGSPNNVLSEHAGRQLSKVRSQNRLRIKGMSGDVDRVYSSAEATLRFGHLQQKNKDIVTLDLSTMNREDKMEVSGFLGFTMLKLLDVKLDYRDGLVDFEYDPKHRK